MVDRSATFWRTIRFILLLLAAAVAFAIAAIPGSAAPYATAEGPIGAHSMLQLNHPFRAKEAMFKEAAAMGVSTIRLDIALCEVFPTPNGRPDWTGVDEYMQLAQRYHLRVLANLYATPRYMIAGPGRDYHDPPRDPGWWGRQAGMIAAHTRGVIDYFEIVNEPDGSWAFHGTPQQYAAMLNAAHQAIHEANPSARVALGGLMQTGPGGKAWMDAVLATRGADATHRFDIANIHIRGRAADAASTVHRWRDYFSARGFSGPLWVTETGYPADAAWQTDAAYQGGAAAQARYLKTAIPAMAHAGAGKVFVTERDSLGGPFASEGVLDSTDPLTADPQYTRRPSFYAVCELTGPPKATIRGRITIRRATVTFHIACSGLSAQAIPGATRLTTTEQLSAHRRTIERLTATPRRPGRGRTLTIARTNFAIRPGSTIRVTIRLNHTGKTLLQTFNRIPATLKLTTTHNDTTTTIQLATITLLR